MKNALCIAALVSLSFLGAKGEVFAEQSVDQDVFQESLDVQKARQVQQQKAFSEEEEIADAVKQLVATEEDAETFVETMIFDLYTKDKQRGAILTRYTDKWFELSDVKEAVEQLLPLRDEKKVAELLKGRIENFREVPGTGSVEINLDTFQIIVSLDADLLYADSNDYASKIPDPAQQFNLQQMFRVSGAGEFDTDADAAFNHRTVSSYGKYWSKIDGTVIRDEDYELQEGSIGGVLGDFQVDTGLSQTDGTIFAPSLEFLGLGIRTSEDIYSDIESLRGSALEVFVPSRSRVDFFRNGRLISSQILEFGLQEVDTRSFPSGSYVVDILITDSGGDERRETKFFTKSGLLTVRDKPNVSLQVGAIRDELEIFDTPVYQFGIKYRATGFMQVASTVYGTDQTTIGSLDTIGVARQFTFEAGISSSLDADLAYRGSLSGSIGDLFFSLNYLETLGADSEEDPFDPDPTPTPTPDPDDDDDIDEGDDLASRLDSIREPLKNFSGQISYQIGELRLRYSGSFNESGDDPRRYTHGPSIDWTFLREGSNTWKTSLAHFETENDDRTEFFISYRRSLDRIVNSTQGFQRFQDGRNETGVRNQFSLDRKTITGRGLRVNLDNELAQREQEDDKVVANNNIRVDYSGSYNRFEGGIRDRRFGTSDSTNFALNAQSAFSVTPDGIGLHRPVNQECMLIAEIESESSSTPVEVLINNRAIDTVRPGERIVAGVSCFQSYRIGIRPTEESELINYETNTEHVTLFPGNIIKRKWTIEKVFIALGRIVDHEGNPIPWKRIKGTKEYVVTEGDGHFQAEISGSEVLTIETDERTCTISFPDVERGKYFTQFGDVVCR